MIVQGLLYTKDHEWVKVDADVVTIGITDYAQDQLGEITYVELPPVDKALQIHDDIGVVESSKAAADVFAPVAGTVLDVNTALDAEPERVNDDCYGEGWICKLKIANQSDLDHLMDSNQYEQYLSEL